MRKNKNGRRLIGFWFPVFHFLFHSSTGRRHAESKRKIAHMQIEKRYLNTFFPFDRCSIIKKLGGVLVSLSPVQTSRFFCAPSLI